MYIASAVAEFCLDCADSSRSPTGLTQLKAVVNSHSSNQLMVT